MMNGETDWRDPFLMWKILGHQPRHQKLIPAKIAETSSKQILAKPSGFRKCLLCFNILTHRWRCARWNKNNARSREDRVKNIGNICRRHDFYPSQILVLLSNVALYIFWEGAVDQWKAPSLEKISLERFLQREAWKSKSNFSS